MEVEGFSFYDDEMIRNGYITRCDNTYSYAAATPEENLSHLLKGYPMQGWGSMRNAVKPMDVSGKVSVDIEWGDDKGPIASVGASASASDDDGNSVSVTVTQDSDGKGSASVSVEHKEDE